MTTQRNEVWAQGSKPGDAPVSSVVVAVDPVKERRQLARERIRAFGNEPRPANGALQRLHDLILVLALDE